MSSSNIFSIAIVGLGTVGTATIQLLENQLTNINNKSGKQIIIKAISAKNKTSSNGLLTGFLNLTIDNAPIIPSDKARFPDIRIVIIIVIDGRRQ